MTIGSLHVVYCIRSYMNTNTRIIFSRVRLARVCQFDSICYVHDVFYPISLHPINSHLQFGFGVCAVRVAEAESPPPMPFAIVVFLDGADNASPAAVSCVKTTSHDGPYDS
jgi:hypothetical protein